MCIYSRARSCSITCHPATEMSGVSFKFTKKSSKPLAKAEEHSERSDKEKDYVVSVEGRHIQR